MKKFLALSFASVLFGSIATAHDIEGSYSIENPKNFKFPASCLDLANEFTLLHSSDIEPYGWLEVNADYEVTLRPNETMIFDIKFYYSESDDSCLIGKAEGFYR